MKYVLKGLALGISLNIADRLGGMFHGYSIGTFFAVGFVFYLAITLFLVSDDIKNFLITGFSGLFFMFLCEIVIFCRISEPDFLSYLAGLLASPVAAATAFVLTYKKVKLLTELKLGEFMADKAMQIKLLVYILITAVSFTYLVLPERAGISVPIFSLIQLACLWFIVPDRKRLILYIPIFVMALNRFISASTVWLVSNYILSIVLFCAMFIKFDIKNDSFSFVSDIISHITAPFMCFGVPFVWSGKFADKKAPVLKRVAIALAITIPCITVLIGVLSQADMVFSARTKEILDILSSFINMNVLVKAMVGIAVGLFLFGAVYNSYREEIAKEAKAPKLKGDMLIINIVLCAVLLVYTMFVVIQFKYLFAGKTLPDGLTYTEYARKGFFELLVLTGVNIIIILSVVKLNGQHSGKALLFTKILCHYLCAVTIVMLVSSYFRMTLYVMDDGLTRLRLFVMIFLAFEAIGLIITFLYIAKPKFNLTMVYIVIALVYYTALNVIPCDYIIAENQVDKYLGGAREDISYVLTLSADAAPALQRVLETTEDEEMINSINMFLEDRTESEIPKRWQRFNLSVEKAKNVIR